MRSCYVFLYVRWAASKLNSKVFFVVFLYTTTAEAYLAGQSVPVSFPFFRGRGLRVLSTNNIQGESVNNITGEVTKQYYRGS